MKNIGSLALVIVLALASQGCSHAVASDPGAPGAAQNTAPNGAPAPATAVEVHRVPVDGLPSMGRTDAPVTIVEFTDYQCPFCQRAEKTIAKLRATYGDSLRVVVAERPLPFHDRARPAALAALAADAQGKFEAMHARLFALGGALTEDAIVGAARDAGLDLARFATDRAAAPLAPSEQLADHLGVQGTPSFFVSGRRVVGAQPYETFRDVIDERLATARALVASGVRPRDVYAALTANGIDGPGEKADKADKPGGDCGGGDGGGCADDCKNAPDDSPTGDVVESVPAEGAPSRGPQRASITIVGFGDFQCPFSAKAEASLHAVEAAHPNDVRIVFKNLPLPMHDQARLAARAALAADAQGHFWEFHDQLFAHTGSAIDRPVLDKIAADLGLDTARFARDIDDAATVARLARDEADAEALKVRGTPTFFVNGRRVVGAQPAAAFEAAIAKSR